MDLSNTLFTSTLAKQDPCGRSVREDVTTNGLATICTSEESARSRIALNLVCQEHGDVELYALLG